MASEAFRWRLAAPCELGDLVRVERNRGATLLAIASGHQDGWSSCWAPGSRKLLDLVVEAWRRERELDAAFESVHRDFPPWARGQVPPDPDGLAGPPGGTFLAAAIDGPRLQARWVGGEVALLIRAGAIVERSAPHTLGQLHGPDTPPHLAHTLTQSVFDEHAPMVCGWLDTPVRDGDRVVLACREVLRVLSAEQVAACADADAIVAAAFEPATIPYAAAIDYRISSVQ